VTTVDWIAVAVIAGAAVFGLQRGLIVSALSLVGVVAGAIVGARIAPHLLHGGSHSRYTPVAALIGATVGAVLFQSVATLLGSLARGSLKLSPLRTLDSAGGLVLGAAAGLAVVWVLGAVALLLPGQNGLRRAAQRSEILKGLNGTVPPRRLLHALARIDPIPAIVAPGPPPEPPDPALVHDPKIRSASEGVVRVLGTACGLGLEGTGWLARPGLVVTAAHVVAGESDTVVEPPGAGATLPATPVVFDVRNDVAVRRVSGLEARPLPLREARPGTPAVLLGYPGNGPLTPTPVRIGRTSSVFSSDAYGRSPVTREITTVSGDIRHGDSGGPAIGRSGSVLGMVFAARIGSRSGFAVPVELLRHALDEAHGPVSTGDCAD
jgi:S1-C subfamily serine protease